MIETKKRVSGGLERPPIVIGSMRGPLLLLATAVIWGTGFVAQRMGMRQLGPLTFGAARFTIASIALGIPTYLLRHVRKTAGALPLKGSMRGGIVCGVILFAACTAQQVGLVTASAGKAGFLTALYIVATPMLGTLLGQRSSKAMWGAVTLALIGMALLCWQSGSGLETGDIWLIVCAVIYAGHIHAVARFAASIDNLMLSWIQTTVCALCTVVAMLIVERPVWVDIAASWQPIIYGGVLPIGIAYTLQVFGQRGAHPAVASLIMSLESVFAAVFGRVILGEVMTGRQTAGAALVFIASAAATLIGERKSEN
ncbi:MAG: DMT family transporter [Oscillospiraceae bacterium]|jgi:drug/metabolite transporter (DMT)-like permease|nr:DMT family transporter [Oscillospiraceae bacterium]